MIFHIAQTYAEQWHALHVVHYITFRAAAGLLTALVLSLATGNFFITVATRMFSSSVREYTPSNHQAKGPMPTMGGIFIVSIVMLSTLLWCNLEDMRVWIFLSCLALFGTVGLLDDRAKIKYKKGISERAKFLGQLSSALLIASAWYFLIQPPTFLCLPFLKWCAPALGALIIPWAIFILVGTSNAVNLTDGLDGLATGSLVLTFGTFSIISYLAGHIEFAQYLAIPYVGTAEIAIIGAIMVGALLGFLWFNTYPAQIFMGDVGSLALGSSLALMALMSRQELLLPLAGGLFVAETVSVMLQVASYKYRGKRILLMAPLHHHFELRGWQEAKITVRCTIVTIVLCLLSLMTLKIR